MPHFAGIDLAWTPHHESGVCVVAGAGKRARLVSLGADVVSPVGLAEELAALGPDVVAAVDAPLLVGPERTAERILARLFGKYRASAHSANAELLSTTNRMAGPLLATELERRGFALDPLRLDSGARGRYAFEVYPHAAHVCWFELDERIKYKRKPKVGVDASRAGLRLLQGYLSTRLEVELPAVCRDLGPTLAPAAVEVRGKALKRLEDELDAVTCMLAAYLGWREGLTGGDIVGDVETGYVVVPGLSRDRRFVTSAPAPTSP